MIEGLNAIEHVDAIFPWPTFLGLSYEPSDPGFRPLTEINQVQPPEYAEVLDKTHHRTGWQWNLYRQKLPMAWEITKGRPSIVIGMSDRWGDLEPDHLEYEVMTSSTQTGNIIEVNMAHKGDGTYSSRRFLGGHGDSEQFQDYFSNHGFETTGMAVALDNNEGMVGTCPECRAVPLTIADLVGFLKLDTDLEMDGTLHRVAVVNCSWHAGESGAKGLMESGIVVVAAAANSRRDNNPPCVPCVVYPPASTYTPEPNDPSKDYRVISVISTADGEITFPHTTYRGPERFLEDYNYGPGTDKFNISTNVVTRKTAKQNAFVDVGAGTGRTLRAIHREITEEPRQGQLYAPDAKGTSYASPQVTGIVGLMMSIDRYLGVSLDVNGLPTVGADVQRKTHAILTYTADKVIDDGRILPYPNPTPAPTQPEYLEQENDPLHRWWAQRMGFGRVNAYRAVAHAIPLKGARLWNVSQTLFNGITSPPTNENGEQLIHFGAYNDNGDPVLEEGGEDLPGEDYNNQGITWIDGEGTTLTVPENSILAIDGLLKTHNSTDNNKIVTADDGKILINGYLEDVEVVGNVHVGDLIIRGSSSGATGCVAIGDDEAMVQVYGNVLLQDYAALNVNRGVLRMKPGSMIELQGENDLKINDGATLEMEQATKLVASEDRRIIVQSGCTLKVNDNIYADIFAHVVVENGGHLVIGEDAVVSIDQFTIERGGEFIVNKGARVSLNKRAENIINSRLQAVGTSNKRITISGRIQECNGANCTTVIDRASIRVEDDMTAPNNRTLCNLKLSYANFSNVPIRTINVPLYLITACSFSAKRSLFEDASQKVLLDIRMTDLSIINAPYNPPNNYPIRERAWLLACDFYDEDGESEATPGTFRYPLSGLHLDRMKRAWVNAGDFGYLGTGVESFKCDSIGIETSEFQGGNFGVMDNGSILRICSNTMKEVEFGNALTSSKSSWIFSNTIKQSSTAFQAFSSFASHYVRGNTFEDFRDAGILLSNTAARLDIASVGRGVPVYNLWGRNIFVYNGIGTIFGSNPISADIRMLNSFANVTLPCGYNQFAELTTYHLYSDIPKTNYPVRNNEFLDPNTGYAIRSFNVATIGTPINTSATLSGCTPATGEYCTVNPPPPHSGGVNPYYVSDGGWVDIAWNDSYLKEAFYHSRTEMFTDTIPTETRLIKMQNALEAALLGDSVEVHLGMLINDYGALAIDTANQKALRAGAWLLKGEVQGRLGFDSLAGLSYKELVTNYTSEADSIPAAWALQAIDAERSDPSFGIDYDSLMDDWRLRVLEDVRRVSIIPSSSPKVVARQDGSGSDPVAGDRPDMTELAILEGNSPNPFNDETIIRFRTMREMKVRLAVSNVHGEEVAVLVDGIVSAGSHEAVFRTSDLPSGVYFYRLEVGGSFQTGGLTVRK